MTSGSEVVYVPVEAAAVVPMAEGGSGGSDVGGGEIYVNWIEGGGENGGIIGRGWIKAFRLTNTPFVCPYNSEEAILEHIRVHRNLDTIFENWRNTYGPIDQAEFLLAAADENVYGRTENNGCIGAQLI